MKKLNQLVRYLVFQGNELIESIWIIKDKDCDQKEIRANNQIKHLIKLNDIYGLNLYDTPAIFSLFKKCLNQILSKVLIQKHVFQIQNNIQQYQKELLQNNTKLFKQIPFYDIPGDLESKEIRNKTYLYILYKVKQNQKSQVIIKQLHDFDQFIVYVFDIN
ncbi:unnamed protein product [Paramecium sonneborni]|uniref:Uncharacterized protein n=1 Tax=Paramecium sonneborni TaxID=65129 RepID=A0A8S1Q733_9CILI|nr:unnamed protein product [Paramecium sonneborni]CAD8111284.1 unnamed protein product [Paramecium sonneborni]